MICVSVIRCGLSLLDFTCLPACLNPRLHVFLQEAHVTRGQVVLGPAPATLRYDDDDDDDSNKMASKKAKERANVVAGSSSSSVMPEERRSRSAAGDEAARGTASGTRASTSDRAGSDSSSARRAAGRSDQSIESTSNGREDGVSGPATASTAKPERIARGKKPIAHLERGEDDDDGDEPELDVAQLQRQLQKAKAAAGGKPLPPSNNVKLSSVVKGELQRELEELHGEKSTAKVARRVAKGSQEEASGPRLGR